MTGWWQIRRRKGTTFTQMLELDRYYCEHLSLGMDLRILLATPLAVVAEVSAGARARAARTPRVKPGDCPKAAVAGQLDLTTIQ